MTWKFQPKKFKKYFFSISFERLMPGIYRLGMPIAGGGYREGVGKQRFMLRFQFNQVNGLIFCTPFGIFLKEQPRLGCLLGTLVPIG